MTTAQASRTPCRRVEGRPAPGPLASTLLDTDPGETLRGDVSLWTHGWAFVAPVGAGRTILRHVWPRRGTDVIPGYSPRLRREAAGQAHSEPTHQRFPPGCVGSTEAAKPRVTGTRVTGPRRSRSGPPSRRGWLQEVTPPRIPMECHRQGHTELAGPPGTTWAQRARVRAGPPTPVHEPTQARSSRRPWPRPTCRSRPLADSARRFSAETSAWSTRLSLRWP